MMPSVFVRIAERYRRWRTYRALASLTEAQLKDIGWPPASTPIRSPGRGAGEIPVTRPRGRDA